MSANTGRAASAVTDANTTNARTVRLLALGGVLVLTASYVSVLREVTAVVGGTESLFALVVAMLAAATVLERTISPRTATLVAAVAAAVGFAYYLDAAGVGIGAAFSAGDTLVSDTITLANGLPLLRMIDAGTWTLGFVPGPVFLSWYLALRRQYALSVVPGGFALLFLVLTGDASLATTVLGVVGGVVTVGFGELERRGGTVAQLDVLTILIAAMIVLSMTVPIVPNGSSDAALSGGEGTLEGTIASAPDRSGIGGQVDLSPEVRFTVASEEPSYWRTGVYDRFTGDEWIRTGQERPYEGPLVSSTAGDETITQTVTLEGPADVMPAAPHPVAVDEETATYTELDAHGQLRPADRLVEGDTYVVESDVVDPSPDALRMAGTDYPDHVTERYLQTPEDVSSEFEAYTAELTADAENPYETALAIETHLRTSKSYSLEVDQPDGNVAEEFLFEMDEGYCVYFATTMVQMLRAEDVPARYAVGYTSGQEIDDGEYVVRGLDAHAWVEVYFPGHGWVAFEPTPGDSRDAVHTERLETARLADEAGVDTDASEDVPISTDSPDPATDEEPLEEFETDDSTDPATDDGPSGDPAEDEPTHDPPTIDDSTAAERDADSSESAGEADEADDEGITWPGVQTVVLGLSLFVGLVAGAYRAGAPGRVRRALRLRWQVTGDDPDADVDRAYRRLECLLERAYRPRRRSESVREYLSSLSSASEGDVPIDERAYRVGRYYERATYGDGVTRAEADAAVSLVDELVSERSSLTGRLR
ncbi:transglutaminaseTgpA domain-containing protein [Natronobeatus ordinarius]|uniref:transglutaminaseTgpA domain-containing protein n=1 Tax=Natronobeatus ordinarius TaxID=2963433 RepID=UPI0020CD6C59|nr:transglutaminaseTgpA domain-containing protein [Natronobeatus ordinarius]